MFISALPSRVEMDSDRGYLDPFVEGLPTTSDFQALFYSTGAKAADFVAEPSEPHQSMGTLPSLQQTYTISTQLHNEAPFTFQGRSLADLVPEWQKGEEAALMSRLHQQEVPATAKASHSHKTHPTPAKSEQKPKNLSAAAKERRR